MDVRAMLHRRKNPFFQHAEAEYFIATRGGEAVGRIAAIHNRLHNETHGDRVGFFGFFETVREQAVADALLDRAAQWVALRGLDTVRGPASFSTNDECGLLIDGFDTPNTLMMPHNPPWYRDLVEAAGFHKAKDLFVYRGGSMAGVIRVPERLERATRIVRERLGLTVRFLNMERFDEEVDLIKALYNRCWEHNWGFVPMTDAEIEHMAKQFRPVVVPSLVPIVEKDGEPVGFGLALPDINQLLWGDRSGRLFPAIPRILWGLRSRSYNRVRIILLGVVPELRGKGIDALLYQLIWSEAGKRGQGWGEAGWILEDNPAMNLALEKMEFTRYKTLRLFDRPA